MKDLTTSRIDRENILNNHFALEVISNDLGLNGLLFESELKFTIQQVSEFYAIERLTINRYLSQYEDELRNNGYEVLKGKRLQEFKKESQSALQDVVKAPQLGVFNFRAFLNLGMLLVESEKAKWLRSKMLDIVIDTLNNKLGGSTKYINQRDEDFFRAIVKEPRYRKEFTSALNRFVDMGNFKYAFFTDKIYKAIFKENAKEYKLILQLEDNENLRDTMYGEVLKLLSSFETGIAHEVQKRSNELQRKLTQAETEHLIDEFAGHPLYQPLIDDACIKMVSRDHAFRNILHDKIRHYLQSVSKDEFERFLGERSKSLEERLVEYKDVFIRLKDR